MPIDSRGGRDKLPDYTPHGIAVAALSECNRLEPAGISVGMSTISLRELAQWALDLEVENQPNTQTRHRLARLDVAVIGLGEQLTKVKAAQEDIQRIADDVSSLIRDLMTLRQELRPQFDPSAPTKFPYDKKG